MILRFFLSLAVGTASSYIFYDFIYHKIILALLIWIIMYIVSWRVIRAVQDRRVKKAAGFQFADIEAEKTVRQGIEKLRNIRNLTLKITSNDVAKQIQDICKTGAEIFDYIRKNPDDLRKAKQFINYYLDTTEKIVNRYVQLSVAKEKSTEVGASLKKVEETLASIDETYKKQLHNLLENDVLDLNTEIKVLETTMKMEN
ncbi:MAG TPA: 5-bromo-4-chloroindolyl phosphate hydrolysis family protein [Spirochaetota bacterium]|nr:5-bromo-4-chloroindolyl phosphate hydrolysis family protein [Spirochaetota bacterium]